MNGIPRLPIRTKIHTRKKTLLSLIWGLMMFVVISPASAQTNLQFRNRVHDPSTIVRCGSEYWTFATGDGIKALHSTNLTDWRFAKPALAVNPPWATDVAAIHRDYFWAPDVIQSNGRYLLYFSVSSWGKNTSAIGLVTSPTLDPADARLTWTDQGIVVRSFATNDFNTIDPAVLFDADGKLWMAFGSYWSGIKLIELDPKTGHRIATNSPMFSLAHNESIEAAFIHRRDTNYFLFVNWGQCCRGTNSTYEIRIGRSAKITGPYLDRDGRDMMLGGGTPFLDSKPPYYGPGHAGIITVDGQDWFSCHYYDGNHRGRSQMWVGKLSWAKDGWPIPPTLDESTKVQAP